MFKYLFLIFFFSNLYAQIIIPEFQGNILDETNTLSLEDKNILHQNIQQLRDNAKVWMAIYIATSLQGTSIEDLADQVFNKWQLGQEKVDNGLLFIMVPSERTMRLEVGYGLEPHLTDAWTRLAQERILKPRFRENQFQMGLVELIQAIEGKVKGEENDFSSQVDDSILKEIIFELKTLPLYAKIFTALPILFFLFIFSLFLKSIFNNIKNSLKNFILAFGPPFNLSVIFMSLFNLSLNTSLQFLLWHFLEPIKPDLEILPEGFFKYFLIALALFEFYIGFFIANLFWGGILHLFKKTKYVVQEFRNPTGYRLRIRYLTYLYFSYSTLSIYFQDESFIKTLELPLIALPFFIILHVCLMILFVKFFFILILPTTEEKKSRNSFLSGNRSSRSNSSSSSSSSRSSSGGGRSGGGGSSSNW